MTEIQHTSEELFQAEGTVILHMDFALKQDQVHTGWVWLWEEHVYYFAVGANEGVC